jgi:talin
MKDLVPPEYIKNKDVEKGIFKEHGRLNGMETMEAKFRYVQLSRSLKTYGVTFFIVRVK